MSRRSALLDALLLASPLLCLGALLAYPIEGAALASAAVAVVALAFALAGFDRSRPALRQVMPVATLSALAVAGRIVFAPFPDVKPVSAICILAGSVFGPRCGFLVGALAALVSNAFFGQGPWTVWQMYGWGLIGYLSGVLGGWGLLERRGAVLAWGFASALLYGLILNGWHAVGFVRPLTASTVLAAYALGAPFDLVHGVATVGFLALVHLPWRRKLERIRDRYALLRV